MAAQFLADPERALADLTTLGTLYPGRPVLYYGDDAMLLLVSRQAGLIVPAPLQAAMIAALSDDAHAVEQRARYAARRSVLAAGLEAAVFRIDHSEAGLYLWATRSGLDCWAACELLAT